MLIKCTSVMAHFDGLADALVLCGVDCLMQHVQGYSKSYWTLPLGNYFLHIAPAATGATANKTTMIIHHLCWPVVCWYDTVHIT
jgi:hypothetical protein